MNVVSNEMFSINPRYEVEQKFIGENKNKICVVHNILEYPDDVYNFVQAMPVELNKTYDQDFGYEGPSSVHNTPGYTGEICAELRPLRRLMNWMASQMYMHQGYLKNVKVRVNAFTSGTVALKRACYPHTDSAVSAYSGTLYLDKKNLGGTSFYRFKNGLEALQQSRFYDDAHQEFVKWNSHWSHLAKCEYDPIDNDENWMMYHLEQMEWNKIVFYEANLFHNVFVKPDMYKNEFRTSINIFSGN